MNVIWPLAISSLEVQKVAETLKGPEYDPKISTQPLSDIQDTLKAGDIAFTCTDNMIGNLKGWLHPGSLAG